MYMCALVILCTCTCSTMCVQVCGYNIMICTLALFKLVEHNHSCNWLLKYTNRTCVFIYSICFAGVYPPVLSGPFGQTRYVMILARFRHTMHLDFSVVRGSNKAYWGQV